jgi:hypothetical protein
MRGSPPSPITALQDLGKIRAYDRWNEQSKTELSKSACDGPIVRGWRRRIGNRDRVGAVPRAGSGPTEARDGVPGHY